MSFVLTYELLIFNETAEIFTETHTHKKFHVETKLIDSVLAVSLKIRNSQVKIKPNTKFYLNFGFYSFEESAFLVRKRKNDVFLLYKCQVRIRKFQIFRIPIIYYISIIFKDGVRKRVFAKGMLLSKCFCVILVHIMYLSIEPP